MVSRDLARYQAVSDIAATLQRALDEPSLREASHAAHALGIALGSRVLRAHDVRGARRTADVMAAVLAARVQSA